jgi:uncharacterized protein
VKDIDTAIPCPILQIMEISDFQWDEDKVAHIARHHVYADEVEEWAFDDEPWIRKGSGGTRYMLGYTISGRYLFVVYALKEKGIARVVTAMGMDEKSRRLSGSGGRDCETTRFQDGSPRKKVLAKAFYR